MSNQVEPHSSVTPAAILATGSTAVQLGGAAGLPARTVFVRADKTNSATIWLGDSTVTSVPGGNPIIDLQAGEGVFFDIKNTNLLWAVSATAQKLYVTVFK